MISRQLFKFLDLTFGKNNKVSKCWFIASSCCKLLFFLLEAHWFAVVAGKLGYMIYNISESFVKDNWQKMNKISCIENQFALLWQSPTESHVLDVAAVLSCFSFPKRAGGDIWTKHRAVWPPSNNRNPQHQTASVSVPTYINILTSSFHLFAIFVAVWLENNLNPLNNSASN